MGCLWCKQAVAVAEADIAPIVTRLKYELLPEIETAVEATLVRELQKMVKPEVKEGKPSTAPGGPRSAFFLGAFLGAQFSNSLIVIFRGGVLNKPVVSEHFPALFSCSLFTLFEVVHGLVAAPFDGARHCDASVFFPF